MNLLDTSCLSLFLLEIPQYDFINELYESNESLNITNYVKQEFDIVDKLNFLEAYLNNGRVKLDVIDYDPILKKKYPFLGEGELSIIQWGLNLKDKINYCCILDDSRARKIANELNLSLSGSIGLIILLRDRNNYSLEKRDNIIRDIRESDFRVDEKILNKIK